MRPFSDLVCEFSNWLTENNIDLSYDEYIKYIWEVPQQAVDQWKTELDDYKHLLPDYVYNIYVKQFEEYGTIMGIYNVVHDNSTSAKLYKVSRYLKNFTINDILVTKNFFLPTENNLVELPDGRHVNLPTSIEHGTLKFNLPVDLLDYPIDYSRGTLSSEGFNLHIRDENKINGNSLLATINYQTGLLHLIRNYDYNEELFVKYYNALKSNSSSNPSSGNPGISVKPYVYLTVSGSFYSLGAPVTLVFEFNCNEQITDENEEYNKQVSYMSEQSKIIQDSINYYKNLSDSHLNSSLSNIPSYDFQLGSTL